MENEKWKMNNNDNLHGAGVFSGDKSATFSGDKSSAFSGDPKGSV